MRQRAKGVEVVAIVRMRRPVAAADTSAKDYDTASRTWVREETGREIR
jgi:hypothetical protein